MTCRLHVWRGLLHIQFTAFAVVYVMIITKNGIIPTSVKHGISYIARTHFSYRFQICRQNFKNPCVAHVINSSVLKCVLKDWSHCRRCFNCYNCYSHHQKVAPHVCKSYIKRAHYWCLSIDINTAELVVLWI